MAPSGNESMMTNTGHDWTGTTVMEVSVGKVSKIVVPGSVRVTMTGPLVVGVTLWTGSTVSVAIFSL